MSFRRLNYKQWILLGIVAVWLVCNLQFSRPKEGESYFIPNQIENVTDSVAKLKTSQAKQKEIRRSKFFWNGKRREVADVEARQLNTYTPEEMYLGIVPKDKYTFLEKISIKNSVEVWKNIIAGGYKDVSPLPENVKWGFLTPIMILVLLVLCVCVGGNIFMPLRKQLKALPSTDIILFPDDDEEDDDDEESDDEEDDDDDDEEGEEESDEDEDDEDEDDDDDDDEEDDEDEGEEDDDDNEDEDEYEDDDTTSSKR